ncbi:MAG TPA: hypothetical protein VF647_05470 [Longimicrobium sp.]|jgi:hypothetical protein
MKTSLIAAALIGIAAGAGDAEACSTGRLYGTRAPLFLLATARSDTVRAGAGPIRYTVPVSDPAAVHGQLFRLDAVGGDVPAPLARARASGIKEGILVPYGWECNEVWRWQTSARWTPPGAQVMVDARLRPPSEWIGGRPTFDVEPGHGAYPDGYTHGAPDSTETILTPAQVFELTRSLPLYEQVERDPFAAYRGLLRWARTHPRLARRFPAKYALEEAQEALEPCVPAYDPHPVTGTYRMTVVAGGTDTVTAYFRTNAAGYPICRKSPPGLDLAAVRPRMADTARLYVHGAATAEAIPATNREANAGGCRVTAADIVNAPHVLPDGARRWRGSFNVTLQGCFPGRPSIREAEEAAYGADRERDPPSIGAFTVTRDGAATFEQIWRAGGRVVLEMKGIRIDRTTH